jgi:hypothetical protein
MSIGVKFSYTFFLDLGYQNMQWRALKWCQMLENTHKKRDTCKHTKLKKLDMCDPNKTTDESIIPIIQRPTLTELQYQYQKGLLNAEQNFLNLLRVHMY